MYVSNGGVKLFWQATGGGSRDLVLLPQCQPVVYSRQFKAQIPYLSRYFRVVTADSRGNGRSDRPATGYDLDSRYGDLLAVLEETVRPPFALVAYSCAALIAFRYVVDHPGHVSHLILLSGQYAESMPQPFEEKVARVMRGDFAAYRQRLFARVLPEPHSLKGIEDCVAWAGETTPDVLIESLRAIDGANVLDLLPRISVPTLALHGALDKIVPYTHAQKMVAAIPGARLVTFEGAGHSLHGRHAVKVNHLIRDFVLDRPVEAGAVAPDDGAEGTTRARAEPRRAASSGCRARSASATFSATSPSRVGYRRSTRTPPWISWLPLPLTGPWKPGGRACTPPAGCSTTRAALRGVGPRPRAARAERAVGHGRDHGGQLHDVPGRRGNRQDYNLWVGDEGWDLDYFLHENPELKRAPYAFLTDFIGVLPMRDDNGSVEFRRAWDKNAENIDHLRLHPDVRDLSIMVGDEEDVLDREFGPDLPNMRQWGREHFRFSGYTYHFKPARTRTRPRCGTSWAIAMTSASSSCPRAAPAWDATCSASVPAAFSLVAHRIPDVRMLLVAGPRLDPAELPGGPRIDVRPYVPHLFRHHAAAHLAIVQGGLTTTMELAAFQTPFLYFPLRNHFEQNFHVARRLDRLGAGVRMDYDMTSPEELGAAILDHLGQARPGPGGAHRGHRARRPHDREPDLIAPARSAQEEIPWPSTRTT